MVPSSLHAGDDWTSLEGGGPTWGGPPTPTSKFSVVSHGEGAQGWGGVRSSASSLQPSTPTHLILYHSWTEQFGGREKGRVPQEAGDPSCPWEPLWLAPPGAAPEAPSPSGSRGPPRRPPGSAGPPSCRWTAGTGYRDYRSSDLPRDTGRGAVSVSLPQVSQTWPCL